MELSGKILDSILYLDITHGLTPAAAISTIFNLMWLGNGRPLMKIPPSWFTRPWPGIDPMSATSGTLPPFIASITEIRSKRYECHWMLMISPFSRKPYPFLLFRSLSRRRDDWGIVSQLQPALISMSTGSQEEEEERERGRQLTRWWRDGYWTAYKESSLDLSPHRMLDLTSFSRSLEVEER